MRASLETVLPAVVLGVLSTLVSICGMAFADTLFIIKFFLHVQCRDACMLCARDSLSSCPPTSHREKLELSVPE